MGRQPGAHPGCSAASPGVRKACTSVQRFGGTSCDDLRPAIWGMRKRPCVRPPHDLRAQSRLRGSGVRLCGADATLLTWGGVALILALLVPVSPAAASASSSVRVGLFGDYLAVQSEPFFRPPASRWQDEGQRPRLRRNGRLRLASQNAHICPDRAPASSGFRARRKHIHFMYGRLPIRLVGCGQPILLQRVDGDSSFPWGADPTYFWHTDHAVAMDRSIIPAGTSSTVPSPLWLRSIPPCDLRRRGKSGRGATSVLCPDHDLSLVLSRAPARRSLE